MSIISFNSPYFSILNVCYENMSPLTRNMFVRVCLGNEGRAKPGMAQPSISEIFHPKIRMRHLNWSGIPLSSYGMPKKDFGHTEKNFR